MIYKLRVILETDKDNVYRDIAIDNNDTLEDLHNVIVQSFDFDGTEPAAFYLTDDELNQGMEIPLFSFDETKPLNNVMNNTKIKDVLNDDSPNLLYIYDFFSLWRFLINLSEKTDEKEPGVEYPQIIAAHGIRPEFPPEIDFETQNDDDNFNDDSDNPFGEFYDYNDDEWY